MDRSAAVACFPKLNGRRPRLARISLIPCSSKTDPHGAAFARRSPFPRMTTTMFVQAVSAMLAIAAAQVPSEPPAAIRRPNLRVLTTVPESQLFLMMNAIADSLGVRCDYCHMRPSPDPAKTWYSAGGWAWDRDDKPAKGVALEMMRMVLDINARQFGGRMGITCYTCHRGSVKPDRLPPLPPRDFSTGPDAPSPSLPSVDEVWNGYVRAVGEPATGFTTTVLAASDD